MDGPLHLGFALRVLPTVESPLQDEACQSPVYDRLKSMSWNGLKSYLNVLSGLPSLHRHIMVRLIAVYYEAVYMSNLVYKSRLLQMINDSKLPHIMP